MNSLRYSLRSLIRSPGFAVTLLLSIAIGVGGDAVVFGFIRGAVSRPAPVPGLDSVVSIFARDAQDAHGPLSYDEVLSLAAHADAFTSVGAMRAAEATVAVGDRSRPMAVAGVTTGFLGILGLAAPEGLTISVRAWQDAFDARPNAVGEAMNIDGRADRVAAVAPEWLTGLYAGRDVDVWMPLDTTALSTAARTSRTFWPIARLGPGVSANAAGALVNAGLAGPRAFAVRPYTGIEPDLAAGIARIRVLLPTAAGVVFAMACATVAAFLLSRSSGRSQETSVRVALGASRLQLGRQLLADSVVIAAAGGALGVLAAVWTASIVPALLFDQDASQLVFAPNLAAIAVAAVSCIAITVACGLAPLVEVRDDDPAAVLRRESGGLSNSARRVRAGLVIGQMACGCLLLIATGLLLDGFRAALRTDRGNRLAMPVVAVVQAQSRFAAEAEGRAYLQRAEAAVQQIPGVSSVTWIKVLPGGRPAWQPVRVEPPAASWRDVTMDAAVFPQKSDAVRHPPKAGRMFGGRDSPTACRAAMIDEVAETDVFDGDAVGRSIDDPTGQPLEIIGVLRIGARGTSGARGRPTVFYYADQTPPPFGEAGPLHFRVHARPATLPTAILDTNVVSPGYFDAVGVTASAGRIFPSFLEPLGCRVGVVNQEAADLYFGGDAVGGAILDSTGHRTTIVGIVPSPQLRTSQRRADPAVYYPMAQNFVPRMTMLIGARTVDAALVASVKRRLILVPGGDTSGLMVMTLDDYLSRTALASERIATLLVGTCATMAMALCLAGVYGAMSDSVRRRQREIAMRIALGAQGRRVVGQVLWEGLQLAGAGAAAGIAASLFVSRWIAAVAPTSALPPIWVWLAAPAVLAAIVAAASVLPARRALSVDPLVIMRDR